MYLAERKVAKPLDNQNKARQKLTLTPIGTNVSVDVVVWTYRTSYKHRTLKAMLLPLQI